MKSGNMKTMPRRALVMKKNHDHNKLIGSNSHASGNNNNNLKGANSHPTGNNNILKKKSSSFATTGNENRLLIGTNGNNGTATGNNNNIKKKKLLSKNKRPAGNDDSPPPDGKYPQRRIGVSSECSQQGDTGEVILLPRQLEVELEHEHEAAPAKLVSKEAKKVGWMARPSAYFKPIRPSPPPLNSPTSSNNKNINNVLNPPPPPPACDYGQHGYSSTNSHHGVGPPTVAVMAPAVPTPTGTNTASSTNPYAYYGVGPPTAAVMVPSFPPTTMAPSLGTGTNTASSTNAYYGVGPPTVAVMAPSFPQTGTGTNTSSNTNAYAYYGVGPNTAAVMAWSLPPPTMAPLFRTGTNTASNTNAYYGVGPPTAAAMAPSAPPPTMALSSGTGMNSASNTNAYAYYGVGPPTAAVMAPSVPPPTMAPSLGTGTNTTSNTNTYYGVGPPTAAVMAPSVVPPPTLAPSFETGTNTAISTNAYAHQGVGPPTAAVMAPSVVPPPTLAPSSGTSTNTASRTNATSFASGNPIISSCLHDNAYSISTTTSAGVANSTTLTIASSSGGNHVISTNTNNVDDDDDDDDDDDVEQEFDNIIKQAGSKKRKKESPLDYFLYRSIAYKCDNDVRGVGRKIAAARSSTASQLERSKRKAVPSIAMANSESFSQATKFRQRKIVKNDNPYRKSRPVKAGIEAFASRPNHGKCSDIESCTSCETSATRQRDMKQTVHFRPPRQIAVKLTKSAPARNNFATTGDLAMGETQNEVSVAFQYKLESDTDDADEEASDVHMDPPSREADKMISSQEDDLTEASSGDDQRLQSWRPNKNNNTSGLSFFHPRLASARLFYGATRREATNQSMPTTTGTMKTRDPRWSRHSNFSGRMSESSSASEDAGGIYTHPSQRPRPRHSPVDNNNVRLSGDQLQAMKIHTGGAATSKYFHGRKVRKVSLESKPSLDFGDDDESTSDVSSQKEDYKSFDYDTKNHDHYDDEAAQQNNVSWYKNSDSLSPPRAPPRPPHQNLVAAHRQVHQPKVRRKSQPSPSSQEASQFQNKNNGWSTQIKPKKRIEKKTWNTARKGTIQHGFSIHKEHSDTLDSVLTVSSKSMKHLIRRAEQAEAKAKRILRKGKKKSSTLLDYGYKKQLVIRINEEGDDDF